MATESKINFEQFKEQWASEMVYDRSMFDIEETMHELYIEYKDALKSYGKDFTVKQWCEFFHQECDLDKHPYMLKDKALQTHHGNSIKQMANRYRK